MRSGVFEPLLVAVLAVGLALGGAGGCAGAESAYPSKDLTDVVGWAAGGTTDGIARALAESTKRHYGRDIIVKNVEGGTSTVGTAEVAKAKPDGYTVLHCTNSALTTVPHLQAVPYKATENFEGVLRVTVSPILVLVRGDSPIKTLKELVSAAKEKPGMTYGTPGEGGTVHLGGVRLAAVTDTKLKAVPFKNSGESVMAVLGGHIDMALAEPGTAAQHITEGTLRALAILEPERNALMPEIPTAREQGYDAIMNNWGGIAVPKGTPAPIVQKLHDAFKKGMEEQAFKDTMVKLRNAIGYMDGKAFTDLWAAEYEAMGSLMRDAGLKKN